MKISTVLTSCNLVSLYCDFIPYFISSWKKLYPTVNIIIVLICDEIPDKFKIYSKYIRAFKPIKGISTAFTSQYVRILYPAIMDCKDAVVITDIDIIPTNKNYFIKPLLNIPDNTFVSYQTDKLKKEQQMYMLCYCIANSEIWKDVMKINNPTDLCKRIEDVYKSINYVDGHGNNGWNTDQKHLYKYINEWKDNLNKDGDNNTFIELSVEETKYSRLSRKNIIDFYKEFDKKDPAQLNDELIVKMSKGEYSDYHCYRPYQQYKLLNDKILDIL